YKNGSSHFDKMKDFLLNYKHFGSIQLGDMHSLAKDIDDEDFWLNIFKNNPIDPSDVSEETYIFKGILAFNERNYETASKHFNKATAIYGRFGKACLFKYFLDCYLKKLKKNQLADNKPCELFTARIDEIYSYIDKKLLSKLKKCISKEDFVKNLDDNLLELDNMLSGVSAKASDIVDIVKRVYKMRFTPACELIKKVIVDNEYNVFIRAVCLANFMMYSNQKKFIIGRCVYENPFAGASKFDIDGERQNFSYGVAIYLALSILEGLDNRELKKECDILERIYTKAAGDYSHVTPLSVFGVLISFFSDEKVHYDKDIVRKREVKAFAQAYVIEEDFFADDLCVCADDDVFDFYRYCLDIL
ncbi:MAG: hypothetical protein K2I23_00505, partial [Clostridia bacterium]|nr:hypothetical protein [Clostridia bacterium]